MSITVNGMKVSGGGTGGGSGTTTTTTTPSGITQTVADSRYLRLSGGVMTGILMLAGDPTQPQQASTKNYVDARYTNLATGDVIITSFNGRTGVVNSQEGDYSAEMVGALPIEGGTLTGALMLSGNPSDDMQAATKQYVDDSILSLLSGGSAIVLSFNGRTGEVKPQDGDYTADQVGAVPLNGGTMTGMLTLARDPVSGLQAATKQYVDDKISVAASSSVLSFNGRTGNVVPTDGDYTAKQVGAVPLSGGTMTGTLTLSGDPASNMHAVTKQYVDKIISSSTGVLSFNSRKGDIVPESGDYTAELVGAVPINGGTMTGMLELSSDPTTDLHAATKRYVDTTVDTMSSIITSSSVISFNGRQGAVVPETGDYTAEQVGALSINGGSLNGALTLPSDPTSNFHAATKQYVDDSISSASSEITNDSVISFNGRQGSVIPLAGDYTAEQVGALALTGGTLTGDLILPRLPADDLAAIPKSYVDSKIIEATGGIVIPTKTSELANDSGYVTWSEMTEAIDNAVADVKIEMASDSDVDTMINEVFGT